MCFCGGRAKENHPDQTRRGDDRNLTPDEREQQHGARRRQRNGDSRRVGAQRSCHAPDGLGNHGHGDDLQTLKDAVRQRVAPCGDSQRE